LIDQLFILNKQTQSTTLDQHTNQTIIQSIVPSINYFIN